MLMFAYVFLLVFNFYRLARYVLLDNSFLNIEFCTIVVLSNLLRDLDLSDTLEAHNSCFIVLVNDIFE